MRTGTMVRIAIATAICAVTAARTGARALSPAGLGHHCEWQINDPVPNIGGENLPDKSGVLRR